MPKITNYAAGPRVLNVDNGLKNAKGETVIEQVTLLPGQTLDVNLHNPDHPVFTGMVESGQLAVDGKRAKGLAEHDKLASDRAAFEKERLELAKREAALADRESELRSQQDIFQRLQREAVAKAGATPGLADPLPPGTDTKGGKESEEALRRQGNDPREAQKAPPSEGGADAAKVRAESDKARAAQAQQAQKQK